MQKKTSKTARRAPLSRSSAARIVRNKPKKIKRSLPVGICETHFFNPEDRLEKDPKKARRCFYAYIGGKERYKAKRFMIDTLGRAKAKRLAIAWRKEQEALAAKKR